MAGQCAQGSTAIAAVPQVCVSRETRTRRARRCPKPWRWRPRRARRPFGADGAASRLQPRRVRLLHELQQPQGGRSLREPSRGVRLSLADDERQVRVEGRVDKLSRATNRSAISEPAAREPAQRVGVAAKREDSWTGRFWRRRSRASRRASRGKRHSMSAVLGRLSNCLKLYRVLAGTAVSASRSSGLSIKW